MTTETTTETTPESSLFSESNRATYAPEDNKLRLYVGRVPRDEYEALRADGWTSTPKQDCDFVATWTPKRRDTCIDYAGIIEDEDQGPDERAADRAERFGGYLDKRIDDASGHADRYESGPSAHGYQNERKAERAAARHDRIGTRATDAWSKAEYWQRRTAGVISHALHVSSPSVRMGRIKTLEADLRKIEADHKKAHVEFVVKHSVLLSIVEHAEGKREKMTAFPGWQWSANYIRRADNTPEDVALSTEQTRRCMVRAAFSGYYSGRWDELSDQVTAGTVSAVDAAREWLDAKGWKTPAPFDFTTSEWHKHLTLRLAYENQMLEAQGGRAAFVEMEVGGWLGSYQIHKVNKSNATGRVVSVGIMVATNGRDKWGNAWPTGYVGPTHRLETITVERMKADVYRPPTEEERAAFLTEKKAAKASAPKKETCPLINPTDEDAEKLQAIHNEAKDPRWGEKNVEVARMTQAEYSAVSKGTHARGEAKFLAAGGLEPYSVHGKQLEDAAFKVRFYNRQVVILTDKPQKPLPDGALVSPRAEQLKQVQDRFAELQAICHKMSGTKSNLCDVLTEDERELFRLARLVRFAYYDSLSQRGLTQRGHDYAKQLATA